jgi:hypothetical protein
MNTLHCPGPEIGIKIDAVPSAALWASCQPECGVCGRGGGVPPLLHADRVKPMSEKTFVEILEEVTDRSRDMDAPLGERLKAVADEVRKTRPEFAATVDRMVARLVANNVGQTAPKPAKRCRISFCPTRSAASSG